MTSGGISNGGFITPVDVTREFLRILHQESVFIKSINRDLEDRFGKPTAMVGDTVYARLPNDFAVRSGLTRSGQSTTESVVPVAMDQVLGIDIDFTSLNLTLDLQDFSERIIRPAALRLIANVEAKALQMAFDVAQRVGTFGAVPTALSTYLGSMQMLDEALAPQDSTQRCMLLSPKAMVTAVDSLKGLFQDQNQLARQYREGVVGSAAGFLWDKSAMMPTYTNGTKVAGLTISGAGQTGSTLTLAGTAGGDTFKKGTVFTIANVFDVNYETKAVYPGKLKQFVITADATAAGATTALSISPAIVTSGASQNVSAGPANAAAVTVDGAASATTTLSLAYFKDAFAFVSKPMDIPNGQDWTMSDTYEGISLTMVRGFDINSRNFPLRIDVLFGLKAVRPQMACAIYS